MLLVFFCLFISLALSDDIHVKYEWHYYGMKALHTVYCSHFCRSPSLFWVCFKHVCLLELNGFV